MQIEIIYGGIICHGTKSNNWKKMHGIPLKAKGRTQYGGKIIQIPISYVSKRNRKKQKKAHFRSSYNQIAEKTLENKPNIKRLYHRYGYMKKKYRKKLKSNIINKPETFLLDKKNKTILPYIGGGMSYLNKIYMIKECFNRDYIITDPKGESFSKDYK